MTAIKLAILALLALTMVSLAPAQAQQPVQNLQIGQGERLLILAPHPDDETLSAAGVVQQVFQRGGTVRSVVITAGDAYVGAIVEATGKANPARSDYLNYGEQRLEESRNVAKFLGKGFVHLDLLGFSDGSIYDMLVTHWQRTHPDKSDYTGFNRVPYREAEDRGTAQDGQDLRNELLAILKDTKPTLIVFPDVMENDSDHAGLGMFALLAVNDWLEGHTPPHHDPRLLAYLIHWRHDWPPGSALDNPIDQSDQPLYLPDDLPLRGHVRSCLNLSKEEIVTKRNALALYKTQQKAMAPFLEAFVHTNECFTQIKSVDIRGIDNVVKQWQHVRKVFDNHPLKRKKIADGSLKPGQPDA
jgi:LmbE family N-acetylglucosaminyl deacetylase